MLARGGAATCRLSMSSPSNCAACLMLALTQANAFCGPGNLGAGAADGLRIQQGQPAATARRVVQSSAWSYGHAARQSSQTNAQPSSHRRRIHLTTAQEDPDTDSGASKAEGAAADDDAVAPKAKAAKAAVPAKAKSAAAQTQV